jgi:hypothetical protein
MQQLLDGPPVRKILFMSTEEIIAGKVAPDITAMLEGTEAGLTIAVDTMLEVVPKGAFHMREKASREINTMDFFGYY